MTFATAVLILATLAGHASLWIVFINNVHGTAMPQGLRQLLTWAAEFCCAAPVLLACWWLWTHAATTPGAIWTQLPVQARFYVLVCLGCAAGPLPWWLFRQVTRRPTPMSRITASEIVHWDDHHPDRPIDEARGLERLVARLRLNHAFSLEVNEKLLVLPRLPAELEGLRIAHFSDLHFSGKIGRRYFEHVVERINEMQADLIALSGDIVDVAGCIDWIPDLLGRLEAPEGVYCVLGNHDLHTGDLARVRRALGEAGIEYLGARWIVRAIRGRQVLLAGNELPWIAPAADLTGAPARSDGRHLFRLLVAHTPDQFEWARRRDFDLMLAGHMHGGQVRLPVVGAFLAPSRQGVRYAAGSFYNPPTLLHVSRGVSSLYPFRFNCPGEITRLELRPAVLENEALLPLAGVAAATA